MEIETYTSEIVKIIGMCHFYLVHPESKHLLKVTFFIAKENGSVLLSCRTTMELGLIKPHACLDYLPPKARLLTSTCDQPSKNKTIQTSYPLYERSSATQHECSTINQNPE